MFRLLKQVSRDQNTNYPGPVLGPVRVHPCREDRIMSVVERISVVQRIGSVDVEVIENTVALEHCARVETETKT